LKSTVARDPEEGVGAVSAIDDIHASGRGDVVENLECSDRVQEVPASDTWGEGAGVIPLIVVGIVLGGAVGVENHAVYGRLAAQGAKLGEFGGIRFEV
jgi:hypothetical protein